MTPFSVIIPAYNEEDGIQRVIEQAKALGQELELILVDDGSTDRTADVARSLGATVVRHPMNAGYGRSLKDGILAARHDVIAIADADGSYPIGQLPGFVAMLETGYDMVVGARQGSHYRGSLLKMPARLVFKFLVEFTTGRRIPDINSGLRVFRRSQILPYFPDLCTGFSFTTTLTLIYVLTGKFVAYVPIDYHRRIGRSKVRFLRDSLRTLQYIIEVVVTYNPLKLFLLLSGGLLLCAAAGLGVFAVRPHFFFLLYSALALFITAVLIFAIGLQTNARRRSPVDPPVPSAR